MQPEIKLESSLQQSHCQETQQLWRIVKTTGGIQPARACQLYNTVAVPVLTICLGCCYIPPYKLAHSKNSQRSINITKTLHSILGQATRFITSGLKGTTLNVLEAHSHILLINLLFCKIQRNAATCICALPYNQPLSLIA